VSGTTRIDLPAFLNTDVVDAIGAGDSFNAGFLWKFLLNHSLSECQRFGNLTGAVSTTAAGGTAAFADFESFRSVASSRFGIEL
jgi:sugar/nucleoside kinase (ribokinase family)